MSSVLTFKRFRDFTNVNGQTPLPITAARKVCQFKPDFKPGEQNIHSLLEWELIAGKVNDI